MELKIVGCTPADLPPAEIPDWITMAEKLEHLTKSEINACDVAISYEENRLTIAPKTDQAIILGQLKSTRRH